MFGFVFANKFPALKLSSQSCCEVSRPRAVGEYEYRPYTVSRNPFKTDIEQRKTKFHD